MIVKVKGIVEKVEFYDNYRVIDVETASGLTYQVLVPSKNVNIDLDKEISIFTSFQVREDSQILYGFIDAKEKEFFEKLISVSGIGPKIAIGVLSMFSVDEVTQVIIAGDHKTLSKASGIGPKGAKKIILELAGILSVEEEEGGVDEQRAILGELNDALSSLGFKGEELKKMKKKGQMLLEEDNHMRIEDLLQKVLRGDS